MMNGPLSGIRVLDLGIVGTGPKTGLILAWLGADVIKVESPRFPDPFRFAAMYPSGAEADTEPWNMAVGANANNRHKRSLCLDYLDPSGRDVLDRLICNCDVLLHNFRMSVADKAGLTWERVVGLNPRMILIALSSQGDSGPRRDYGSYGTTLEGLGGISALLGSEDAPLITGVNFPDQACPLLAVGAISSALVARDVTGEGAFIDFAQLEATALLTGDVALAHQTPGLGETDASASSDEPTGVFACSGDDEWIAVEVTSDAAWQRLNALIDFDPGGVRYPTAAARRAGRDQVRTALASWLSSRDPVEAEQALRAAGVAAARALRGPEVLRHPQLASRNFFEDIESPRLGLRRYNGNALGRSLLPQSWLPHPAAKLGEHNREVLVTIAGLTHSRVDELESAGIIGNRPLGGMNG